MLMTGMSAQRAISRIQALGDDFTVNLQDDYVETGYVLVDLDKPGALQDRRVRCAMSLALDRDDINAASTDGLSDAQAIAFLRHNFPHMPEDRIKRALGLWNEYRDFTSKGSSGRSLLSYRALDQLLRLLERGMDETRAVQIALINKFLPGDSELFSAAKLKNSLGEPGEPAATQD